MTQRAYNRFGCPVLVREAEIQVKKISHGYYEVIDGEKWYTASLMTNGLWFVVNHQGRAINQGTAVHRRVVATLPADGR